MLLLAAILLTVLAAAHSYLGERYLLRRLFRRDNLPIILGSRQLTEGVLRLAWHVTSLTWWGMAAVLVYMQVYDDGLREAYLWMLAIVFGISGAASLIWGRGKHLSWAFFLAIAGLAAYTAIAG